MRLFAPYFMLICWFWLFNFVSANLIFLGVFEILGCIQLVHRTFCRNSFAGSTVKLNLKKLAGFIVDVLGEI